MTPKPQLRHVSLAAALLAAAIGAAHAQETQQLERIEITGSSIKRVANEGALPVQLITQEEIKASGANNVADLIQRIPAMGGNLTVGDVSIGSNSGGIATASILGRSNANMAMVAPSRIKTAIRSACMAVHGRVQ